MRPVRRVRNGQSQCEHEQTVASVVAGMERVVCESCGHVSVKWLNDSIERGGIPTPRYEVDSR